jgi:hypothetical protein
VEWLQCKEHLFGAFEAAHYRPKERLAFTTRQIAVL